MNKYCRNLQMNQGKVRHLGKTESNYYLKRVRRVGTYVLSNIVAISKIKSLCLKVPRLRPLVVA